MERSRGATMRGGAKRGLHTSSSNHGVGSLCRVKTKRNRRTPLGASHAQRPTDLACSPPIEHSSSPEIQIPSPNRRSVDPKFHLQIPNLARHRTRDQRPVLHLLPRLLPAACSADSAPRMLLATNGLLYCRRRYSSGLLSISRLNFSSSSGNFLIAG
nr:hypothetical protein Itr_chr02CG04200 [Ipomoea trifida]